jgi:hypothetical protein
MGSYSLPDGRDVVLTIKATKREQVTGTAGKKQDCFVCYFVESDKPMILNRTNCKTIEKVLGTPYIEDWVGKKIQVGIDTVSAFGESVDALRVRRITPKEKVKTELLPSDAKWPEVVAWIKGGGSIESIRGRYTVSDEVEQQLMKEANV